MGKLEDLRGQAEDRRQKLAAIFAEAGPDYDMDKVKAIDGDSQAKVDQIKALNAELDDLVKQAEDLQGLAGIKSHADDLTKTSTRLEHRSDETSTNTLAVRQQQKSLGELFTESAAYKSKNVAATLDVNVKTLFATDGGAIAYTGATAGWYPMDVRTSRLVDYALARQPLRVADIIPSTTTTSPSVTYYQEGAFSNSATAVTEGSAKPEAALVVGTVTEAVRKIAVLLPITDEQLADVPMAQGYVNNRLGFMVRQLLDSQILTGDGNAPNLKGILNRSSIQTQAKGTDPVPDAVYKAITKIRVNDFSEPNTVVMHPNDWQDVRLLTTADGIYIWGSPADAGPERIWGLQVITTTAETENTALVGDFNQAELAMRTGLEFATTDSHSTYFANNITVIRAELRAALLVYREAAFCKVTGV